MLNDILEKSGLNILLGGNAGEVLRDIPK